MNDYIDYASKVLCDEPNVVIEDSEDSEENKTIQKIEQKKNSKELEVSIKTIPTKSKSIAFDKRIDCVYD